MIARRQPRRGMLHGSECDDYARQSALMRGALVGSQLPEKEPNESSIYGYWSCASRRDWSLGVNIPTAKKAKRIRLMLGRGKGHAKYKHFYQLPRRPFHGPGRNIASSVVPRIYPY